MFDFDKYRKAAKNKLGTGFELMVSLDQELEHAIAREGDPEYLQKLVSYRRPSVVAVMEYRDATRAGVDEDEALTMAIRAAHEHAKIRWDGEIA
jgi:hypothetical protein